MKRILIPLLLLTAVALAGCQTIKAHNPFRDKTPDYQAAKQEQPLEVPPGMQQPPTAEALTIPNAGSGSAPTSTAVPSMTTPSSTAIGTTAPPAAETPPAATVGASGPGLQLSDTPDSAYHRVGLALARGDVGQVTAHGDATHTYQVAVNTTVTEKPQGGFFHRLFHRSHTENVTGTVTVSVAPQGTGSVVQATGNSDAAARVMAVLRQRLQ